MPPDGLWFSLGLVPPKWLRNEMRRGSNQAQ